MDTTLTTVPTPHHDVRSKLDEANRPEVLVFVLHEPTSTGETPLGACTTSCLATFGFSSRAVDGLYVNIQISLHLRMQYVDRKTAGRASFKPTTAHTSLTRGMDPAPRTASFFTYRSRTQPLCLTDWENCDKKILRRSTLLRELWMTSRWSSRPLGARGLATSHSFVFHVPLDYTKLHYTM